MTIIKPESELPIIWENSLNLMQNDDTSYNYKVNPNRSNTYMFWLLTWGRYSNSWKVIVFAQNSHLVFRHLYWLIYSSLWLTGGHLIWNLEGRQGALGLTVSGLPAGGQDTLWLIVSGLPAGCTGFFVINCVRFTCRFYTVVHIHLQL